MEAKKFVPLWRIRTVGGWVCVEKRASVLKSYVKMREYFNLLVHRLIDGDWGLD